MDAIEMKDIVLIADVLTFEVEPAIKAFVD
jgi:hypothetical protein